MSEPHHNSRGPQPTGHRTDGERPDDASDDDLAQSLSLLRDDIARLTESLATMLRGQAGTASERLRGVANDTYSTASEAAGIFGRAGNGFYEDASRRMETLSTELKDTVVRAPLISLALAAFAGMMWGRLRR